MATSGHRDPRSIVTPDAFEVSADLVGMPLAAPTHRAIALAIDGIVIVSITALTRNFSLILGVIAAGLFIRAGFRRTPVRGNVFGRAMRFSVGCLGVLIALVTAALWSSFGIGFGRGERDLEVPGAVAARAGQVLQGFGAAVVLEGIQDADGPEEALAAAAEAMPVARELGLPDDVVRDILLAAVPDSVSWRGEWATLVDGLIATGDEGTLGDGSAVPADSAGVAAIRAEVEGYTDDETFREYAALLTIVETDAAPDLRTTLLRERIFRMVAGDSVEALEGRSARLERQRARLERDLQQSRDELEEATSRGIFRRLLDLANDLGFGFGWAALYMTVVLAWWNGQTVGKRVMRIRVVRLDGGPITWWVAFERVGGYAAGVATGLLGFAQVWWDANRQAIHDRIVGTVVVQDGAEKVLDWESAL